MAALAKKMINELKVVLKKMNDAGAEINEGGTDLRGKQEATVDLGAGQARRQAAPQWPRAPRGSAPPRPLGPRVLTGPKGHGHAMRPG